MNILALDTSMGGCSAALSRGDGARFSRQQSMERGHAEALMPMVAAVMQEAELDFAAIGLIAATTGPGSFTGVRIAISAARGLALVTHAKLFGTDSLSVMAKLVVDSEDFEHGPFAVAADARRGMIYLGVYEGDGSRREGPLLIAPDAAVSHLARDVRVAAGSGATILAEAATSRGRILQATRAELQPSASALAAIARESGETVTALRPLYLRPPDAKPQGQAVSRC